MAQGKMKVKSKAPPSSKKVVSKKGNAFSKRKNAPIQSKKHKFQESAKLKQAVSKTVNKKNEDEIRKLVYEGQKNLSQAQQAVVEHHKRQPTSNQAGGSSSSK
ncbi:uncharacterized protein LOC129722290 [Wyeomyia smithii]|uniref:uncharacterized protein LOC129722290 n=1 Tax=Wyeomyia smithii TaxID=174621 RepID=UPI002467F019|nr:uncharacterized protein LOC129722290 [Wyeomyia smithii]